MPDVYYWTFCRTCGERYAEKTDVCLMCGSSNIHTVQVEPLPEECPADFFPAKEERG